MPKQIIKDAALVEDNWILIERADEAHKASELPEGDLILPVQTFNALITHFISHHQAHSLEA